MDLIVGATSNVVKPLVNKLGSLLAQEYSLIGGISDDIQYINDELASMQAFLNGLQQVVAAHNVQRQDWMKQVREVAYDIEDCVDNLRHHLRGEPRGSGWLVSLKQAWYLLTTLHARHSIATEIGNLKAQAQHVSERRTRYGVENLPENMYIGSNGANAPRDRLAPPPQLIGTMAPVGIEDAMKDLKPWFMDAEHHLSTDCQLRFLAIVGFGGLGKTTLSMALYQKFGDKFNCRATVLASQKFHLPSVLRSLIKKFHEQQFGASKNDLEGIEEWREDMLKKKLADQLREKRYLVLIDDIWSVSAWETFKDYLPKKEKGGTIVVTTRFKSVAEACRRQHGHVYQHMPLPDGSSYNLFHETISSAASDLPIARPINISMIMKTCGGLPLALVLVAGLMASELKSDPNSTLDTQLEYLDGELSAVLGNNLTTEGVTQILNHCYNNLQPDLKTCLLYLSMFSKGSLISRKRLVRRWEAEGLITEKYGKTIEEIAEDCFNELISRNLIRVVNSSSNGKVKNCVVHDMVLEYIVAKSSDENFITVVGGHWQTPFPSYKVRRLSIHKSDPQEKEMVERMKLSHVRSLTALESFRALHSTMHKLRILQVLDLEGCKDISLNELKKICSLHQLKYLSLRQTDIEKIPSNISKLEYLEFFDIRDTNIRKLPASVERLQRITHLLAGNKNKRRALKLTEGITKMTTLQTLSGVEIYGSSGGAAKGKFIDRKKTGAQAAKTTLTKEQHSFADLEKLTNLKKLTIYRLVGFTNSDNELLLSAVEHLSSCFLKFFSIDDDFCGFLESSLCVSQAPPEHLHTLGLSGKLSQVPNWIHGLHNLERLTLSLTSLKTSTLLVLSELPELFSLIFTLNSTINTTIALQILQKNIMESEGSVFVTEEGFKKLKLLRFMTPVLPPLSFLKGAMPELQRLELRFVMTEGVYGLENLERLRQVVLTVSSQAPADAKAKVSQMKALANMNPNGPSVVVDEYNESS